MKATTYKELKKWIDEGVDLAELAQGYADKVPNADREQFEAITQEIFNVLEGVSLMLDDKVLIYNRKAEQNVAYKLSEIEGKTLTETASFLGFGNSEVCRSALYKWKRKKWLKFDLKNGHYRNVEVLHEVTLEKMANKELKEQGLIYKANIYYEQVVSTSEIIEDIKTKTQDRIKAIHLQQKALERIPSELFAELYTNMN